ncbi:TonB-dependent receptor SusC [termite gut metagenome]|uniref:TonB-dependent receptor SusC n=1 Tax=termite gut metagenome TaxID=433724 RepID=A0A5J4R942_9ZZZZ
MKKNMGTGACTSRYRKFMNIMRNMCILLLFFATSHIVASSGQVFNEIGKNSDNHSTTSISPQQNSKRITGKVTDATGEPIIGASVLEKGTQNGAITDIEDKYAIEFQSNNKVLTVSYIGYISKDVSVGNTSVLNVVLEENVQKLVLLIMYRYYHFK